MTTHVAFVESSVTGPGYELIRAAKERGWRITFVTSDLDAYQQPGQLRLPVELIDDVVVCDTDDPHAVVSALRTRAADLDALISVSEYHMLSATLAGRTLGLKGQDPGAIRAARDKSLTRSLCSKAGVPGPRFALATSPDAAAAADVGFPCVVKPVDESASQGVRLCASRQEVSNHTAVLLANKVNEIGQARIPAVLVEEFLRGPEVSVETVTFSGETQIVAVTEKVLLPPPEFYELGHVIPAELDPEVAQACRDVTKRALDAIGHHFGAAHVELKLTASGPRLVEVNCRLAGDQITHLVKLASGYDMHAALLDMYLGRQPSAPPPPNRAVGIMFLPSPGGRVRAIGGVEAARSMAGVVEVGMFVEPRAVLAENNSNLDRLGYVIATAAHGAAALSAASEAAAAIHVEFDRP